ncbi:VOC family protein [Thalassotalea euphylliae]|uniref:VOC family protein n=1 Tax=Thalassotalea euphylliae TaxID=1655234 RepID=A0A3E0TLB1_9GAMM|nr:VOC family protein [Thalassotalea euphylliae]REL25306.1 VOC family protein [Thalassotalea euphylliae]
MLYLEHVNIVVKDIPASLIFYQAAFPHWRVRCEGSGEWYGKPRNWLHFGDDYQYLALSDHGEGTLRDNKQHQVGLAHFGYVVQNLNAVIERLTKAGFPVDTYGTPNPHRQNAYFVDPTGYEVEFIEYFSDVPSERNNNQT